MRNFNKEKPTKKHKKEHWNPKQQRHHQRNPKKKMKTSSTIVKKTKKKFWGTVPQQLWEPRPFKAAQHSTSQSKSQAQLPKRNNCPSAWGRTFGHGFAGSRAVEAEALVRELLRQRCWFVSCWGRGAGSRVHKLLSQGRCFVSCWGRGVGSQAVEGEALVREFASCWVRGTGSLVVKAEALVCELLRQRRVDYGGARWPDLVELRKFAKWPPTKLIFLIPL